ncbi:MAG: hypothetical protein P8Z30_16485 [Acidobacteriota bacterium]
MKARDLKPFSAARILALNEIISPEQVRPGFLISRPVALVGVSPQTLFLCPLNPSDLVRGSLTAEQAGEIGRLQNFLFVEKVPFFHELDILT